MGCDIHPVVQRKIDGQWVDVDLGEDNPLEWRNYQSFAILADVRNRSGYKPIAPERGLPDDFQLIDEVHPCFQHSGKVLERTTGNVAVDPLWRCDDCTWMGDHSWTWVTLAELEAYGWDETVIERFTVDWDSYVKWAQEGQNGYPDSYSRGVSGGNSVTVTEAELPPVPVEDLHTVTIKDGKSVYVNVEKELTVGDGCPILYSRVLPWLREFDSAPEDVRIVMGFDS